MGSFLALTSLLTTGTAALLRINLHDLLKVKFQVSTRGPEDIIGLDI